MSLARPEPEAHVRRRRGPFGRALRLARWVLVLGWAAWAGWLIRRARRLFGKPPRIWHFACPVHWDVYLVAADQAAGYPSRAAHRRGQAGLDAVARDPGSHGLLDGPGVPWDDVHWRFLADLLRHGDVFVAYFESHFFRPDQRRANHLCLGLLRALGVRIVVCAHGGDVVHRHPTRTRYDWIGREQLDYPDWDLSAQTAVAQARIQLFCRHATLVLPADATLARFLPRGDVRFKYFPIDTERLRPRAPGPGRQVPLIVHAPNHRLTKGTDFLLRAVEQLQSRGVPCELRVVEKLPRPEALEIYAEADIIADQFCIGSYGTFAIEGLALAKPVLAFLDEEHLGDPVFNLPIVNTTPENLPGVLAVLLAVPELRTRLGQIGRESVVRFHSIPAMAEVWDRLHRHVWWNEALELETTAHFAPTRQVRSFSEEPSEPDFWPVPVEDLWPRITAALERIGWRAPTPWPGC